MGEIFVFNEGQELTEFWKGLCGQSEKPEAAIQVCYRFSSVKIRIDNIWKCKPVCIISMSITALVSIEETK